jgi:hypothetical protein
MAISMPSGLPLEAFTSGMSEREPSRVRSTVERGFLGVQRARL